MAHHQITGLKTDGTNTSGLSHDIRRV